MSAQQVSGNMRVFYPARTQQQYLLLVATIALALVLSLLGRSLTPARPWAGLVFALVTLVELARAILWRVIISDDGILHRDGVGISTRLGWADVQRLEVKGWLAETTVSSAVTGHRVGQTRELTISDRGAKLPEDVLALIRERACLTHHEHRGGRLTRADAWTRPPAPKATASGVSPSRP